MLYIRTTLVILVWLISFFVQAIDYNSLYQTSHGEGEPVLIVHGGPGFDSHHLTPLVNLLSDFTVIIYDQRGSGFSKENVSKDNITMKQFVNDLEYIRHKSGFEKVHVLGNSFGGLIASYYALAYPERVKSLILLSSVPLRISGFAEVSRRIESGRTVKDNLELNSLSESKAFKSFDIKTHEEYYKLFFKAYFHNKKLAADLELNLSQQTIDNMETINHLMYENIGQFDLFSKLGQFNTFPVLILHGKKDPFPYLEMQAVHEKFVRSEIQVFSEAGHFLYIEKAKELVRRIQSFIKHEK